MNELVSITVIVAAITVLYRVAPYRELGDAKPRLAVFPKYRTSLDPPSGESMEALEEKLAEYGFRKSRESEESVTFSRGSLLGDFSIRLAKMSLKIAKPIVPGTTARLEAAWVMAFDTGDLWDLLSELREKLEASEQYPADRSVQTEENHVPD